MSASPVASASSSSLTVSSVAITASEKKPPVAPQEPVNIGRFGDICADPYAWMQDPENAEAVNHYLELWDQYSAERYAADGYLEVEDKLYKRMVEFKEAEQLNEDPSKVPNQQVGAYTYYWSGDIYYRYCDETGKTEPVFDNSDFQQRVGSYQSAGAMYPSPDGTRIAFAIDFLGNECGTCFVYDIASGGLTQVSDRCGFEVAWDVESEKLYFVESQVGPHHTQRGQSCKAYIGDGAYEIVYTEQSPDFQLGINRSDDGKYLILTSDNYDESEVRYLPLDGSSEPQLIAERKEGSLYRVAIADGRVLIWESWTNLDLHNFQLRTAKLEDCGRDQWVNFGPYDPTETDIHDVQIHKDFIAVAVRENGVAAVHTLDLEGKTQCQIKDFPETAYSLSLEWSPYDSTEVYYSYQSGIRPKSTWRQDFEGQQRPEYVSGVSYPNFDPKNYVSETLQVPYAGHLVPMVVCYRKDASPADKGPRPCLVNPYGDYGTNNDPWFRLPYATFMEQGGIMVFPQVPGGAELGQDWYHFGRKQSKENSMQALVECTKELIKRKYSTPGQLALMVKSAGGILGGWIANQHPKLYRVIDVRKGWTNCLLDMLHTEYPLTAVEQSDRGVPATDSADYFNIKGYSPQENIRQQAYPAIGVIAAHDDGDVPDYVAARYLAALQANWAGENPLLARFEEIGGHYDDDADTEDPHPGCREGARELAFVSKLVGLGEAEKPAAEASVWNLWGYWV